MSESRHTDLIRLMRNETWKTSYPDLEAMATAVMAAGWAPGTPLAITELDELDGFPVDTVVRVAGMSAQRVQRSTYAWTLIGNPNRYTSEQLLEKGVVELLFHPQQQA